MYQSQSSKKSLLQRRQASLQARKTKRARDIVVVKPATDTALDEDIRRLQAHLAACAVPLAADQVALATQGKE
ncbi:hypothetical protein MSG28_015326, partial [Choristoneura fumiferana]